MSFLAERGLFAPDAAPLAFSGLVLLMTTLTVTFSVSAQQEVERGAILGRHHTVMLRILLPTGNLVFLLPLQPNELQMMVISSITALSSYENAPRAELLWLKNEINQPILALRLANHDFELLDLGAELLERQRLIFVRFLGFSRSLLIFLALIGRDGRLGFGLGLPLRFRRSLGGIGGGGSGGFG